MIKNKKNQNGFSVVEALLIIIILAIVGFGGWYVWNRHNEATEKQTAQKTASKKQTTNKKKAIVKNVIKIKEIGIQFTVPDSLKDLSYITEDQTDTQGKKVVYVRLSSATIAAKDAACDPASSALGVITKGLGTYPPSGMSADDLNSYYLGFKKQFSGFFIGYSKSQASCASGNADNASVASTSTLQTELETAINSAMSSLELIK